MYERHLRTLAPEGWRSIRRASPADESFRPSVSGVTPGVVGSRGKVCHEFMRKACRSL